jgi:hypothetical protein
MSSRRFPMLKKRGQWWSYLKRVPNHLRAFFNGRREIVVSLHTRDEGEAGARVLAIALETEKDLQRARERFRTLVIDPDALAKEWKAQSAPAPCATFPDSPSRRPNLLLGLTRRVSLPERRFQHLRIEAENWSRWPKARRTTCTSPDSGLLDAFSPTRIWKR